MYHSGYHSKISTKITIHLLHNSEALQELTCALPYNYWRYVEQVTKLTAERESNPNEKAGSYS